MQKETPALDDARLRLEAARFLLQGQFYGDAVSRAYYGAHQATLALLGREGCIRARIKERTTSGNCS